MSVPVLALESAALGTLLFWFDGVCVSSNEMSSPTLASPERFGALRRVRSLGDNLPPSTVDNADVRGRLSDE